MIAIVLLGAVDCSGPRLGRWFRATGPAAMSDGAAVFAAAGVEVRVRETSGSERLAVVSQAGLTVDPFDVNRDGRMLFRTFLVTIRNDGAADVRFNPSFCAANLGGGERRYPLGYTELYRFLDAAVSGTVSAEQLAPLLPETSFLVSPGEARTVLIVFNRVKADQRRLEFELSGLDAGAAGLDQRIMFERDERVDR